MGSDTLINIEAVSGSNFDDVLIGNSLANQFPGNQLLGRAGNDLLIGGAGNDSQLDGGTGDDTLDGGEGSDTATYFNSATSGVIVDLRITGVQHVGGGLGSDTLISIENLVGSNFDDTLTGDDGSNTLTGLIGADILTGEGGGDSFTYRATSEGGDLVTDFVHGADRINVQQIDANTAAAGNQAFIWGETTVTPNGIWYTDDGENTIIEADVDGDESADFQITLLGTDLGLTASDFIL